MLKNHINGYNSIVSSNFPNKEEKKQKNTPNPEQGLVIFVNAKKNCGHVNQITPERKAKGAPKLVDKGKSINKFLNLNKYDFKRITNIRSRGNQSENVSNRQRLIIRRVTVNLSRRKKTKDEILMRAVVQDSVPEAEECAETASSPRNQTGVGGREKRRERQIWKAMEEGREGRGDSYLECGERGRRW